MKHRFIFAAAIAAGVGVAAVSIVPASAQPFAADLLPAYEVGTIVASMGMRPVGRPAWMRGRYVIAAIDRYGREVNVVLDARDGQVLAVRPLSRDSFDGPPPPFYRGRGGPYGPMQGGPMQGGPMQDGPMQSGPVPGAITPDGGMPPEDDEFFDSDRQEGALPPPRVAARPPLRMPPANRTVMRDATRNAGVPRNVNVPRNANINNKDAASAARPVPRPRPAGVASVPAGTPVGTPPNASANASAKPDAAKSDTAKSDTAKSDTAKPGTAKPSAAAKPEPGKADIRVIDLSKPKAADKAEAKPGEAIRF